MDDKYQRPSSTTDSTVEAAGKVSEALEWVERARGDLYEFHQKIGRADIIFTEAAKKLRDAGHTELADMIMQKVGGRNVMKGRWSFQMIDEFEEVYYQVVKNADKQVRDELMAGKKHVYESELKEKIRTKNEPGHESRPGDVSPAER